MDENKMKQELEIIRELAKAELAQLNIPTSGNRLGAIMKRCDDLLHPPEQAYWPLDETAYAFSKATPNSYGHSAYVWLKWLEDTALPWLKEMAKGDTNAGAAKALLRSLPGAER